MSGTHKDVNVYSQDGRIFQVEYAIKATSLGTTTIGVALSDCVVLVSEKKLLNQLQNPKSVKKHFKIHDRIAIGMSGISSDGPAIVERCRRYAMTHLRYHHEQIPIKKLLNDLCSLALGFSESKPQNKIFSRPFGLSLLVASFDDKPELYGVDPSGSFNGYFARVIGSASEAVNTTLESEYDSKRERGETIGWLINILKKVIKDKVLSNNVEVTVVDKDGVQMLDTNTIERYMQ